MRAGADGPVMEARRTAAGRIVGSPALVRSNREGGASQPGRRDRWRHTGRTVVRGIVTYR